MLLGAPTAWLVAMAACVALAGIYARATGGD